MFVNKQNAEQTDGAANPAPAANQRAAAERRVRTLSKVCGGLVAVAVAGAGLGAYGAMSASSTKARYTENAVEVVLAANDVPAGQVIKADDLQKVSVPATFRADGAMSEEQAKALVGQTATVNITKNEQLTSSMATGSGNTSKLSRSFDAPMVSVTIETDVSTGMAGLLKKGDHLWLMTSTQNADGTWNAETVVPDCEVLALGSDLTGATSDASADSSYASVTVSVTEEQAQAIEEAKKGAGLSVALLPSEQGAQQAASAERAGA